MDIKVINNPVAENHSLTTIQLGTQNFALTEKELYNLIYQLNLKRDDIVKEVLGIEDGARDEEVEELEAIIEGLEKDLEEANERIEELDR